MFVWAGNFIVVKSAVAVLPPVGFTFLRFALASTTLLVLLRWREGSVGLPRRDLLAIMGFGALGFGLYQILWTTGLTTVAAGDSALIIAATPVLVALLAVVAGTDVLTPTKLAGGPRLVRGRRRRHRVRAGPDAGRVDRRRDDHARRGSLLVDLHGVCDAVRAALLAAASHRLGNGRGHACAHTARDLPAGHGESGRARPGRRPGDPLLRIPRSRDLERHRDERREGRRARRGRQRSSSSFPRSPSSSRRSSSPSRSGPARSSAASSSWRVC